MTGERLLVVDDSAEMRSSLADAFLNPMGFEVLLAENGAEGMKRALADRPDLIITDQVMPNMTGTQLAKKLISIRPDIPVILCSGFPENVDLEEVEKIGIKKFIMKPIGRDVIAKIVRAVLDGSPIPV